MTRPQNTIGVFQSRDIGAFSSTARWPVGVIKPNGLGACANGSPFECCLSRPAAGGTEVAVTEVGSELDAFRGVVGRNSNTMAKTNSKQQLAAIMNRGLIGQGTFSRVVV
jgi:hypothetical protein